MILRIQTSEGDYPLTTDTEAQKYGEQIGLDTLVVHTVTYEY